MHTNSKLATDATIIVLPVVIVTRQYQFYASSYTHVVFLNCCLILTTLNSIPSSLFSPENIQAPQTLICYFWGEDTIAVFFPLAPVAWSLAIHHLCLVPKSTPVCPAKFAVLFIFLPRRPLVKRSYWMDGARNLKVEIKLTVVRFSLLGLFFSREHLCTDFLVSSFFPYTFLFPFFLPFNELSLPSSWHLAEYILSQEILHGAFQL